MNSYLERLKRLSEGPSRPTTGGIAGQAADKTDRSTVGFVGVKSEKDDEKKAVSADDLASPMDAESRRQAIAQAVDQIRRFGQCCKIYSETLGCQMWLVNNESDKRALQKQECYDQDPILTLAEVDACKGLTKADLKALWPVRNQFGAAFVPPRPEESTPPAVASDSRVLCGDCIHFQPDTIGDGSGIGSCRAEAKTTAPLFPRIPRCCASFCPKKPDEDP